MQTKEFFAHLQKFEQTYPSNDWVYDDFEVWPRLRVVLADEYYRAFVFTGQSTKKGTFAGRMRRVRENLRSAIWSFCRTIALISLLRHDGSDVVFLSQSGNLGKCEDHEYDRIFDPFVSLAESTGLRCALMGFGELRAPTRKFHSVHFLYLISIAMALPLLLLKGRFFGLTSAKYRAYRDHWRQTVPAVRFPSMLFLLVSLETMSILAGFFEILLKCSKTKPKLALTSCYYSAGQFAFVLGCRRRGIPVGDVQHGGQGELHVAYGRWTTPPPNGFRLLPDFFWCWSEDDARVIRDWAGDRHPAFVGGNLWVEHLSLPTTPLARHLQRSVNLPKSPNPVILVTLQWGIPDFGFTRELRRVILETTSRYKWWIRLHPLMNAAQPDLVHLLTSAGVPSEEVASVTNAPLPLVMSQVSAHVTACSGAVQEAARLGVLSICVSELARGLFRGVEEAGMLMIVEGAQAIRDALESALQQGKRVGQRSQEEMPGLTQFQALVERGTANRAKP